MKKFIYRTLILFGGVIAVLVSIAVGSVYGVGKDGNSLLKFWFDVFGLLGIWLSGIGALAAAYAALYIAGQNRQDNQIRDKIRTLHHTMAIVNDLRARVTNLKRVLEKGGQPLAALTCNGAALIRRYEVLYDRELYTVLPGHIVDRITNMSGSFCGIEITVTVLSSLLENKADKQLPSEFPGQNNLTHFEQLFRELDDLFNALDSEREKLNPN